MNVELDKVVCLAYELSISDKQNPLKLVESVQENKPMLILFGSSGLPIKFEEKIQGLKSGDPFTFTINADEGFGDFDQNEIMNLPIEDFFDEGNKLDTNVFKVGRFIPMVDEDGHHIRGKILEVNESAGYIKMDFNHPLAGKDMHFTGKIVSVREATPEEIAHGHVHGEGGHHH